MTAKARTRGVTLEWTQSLPLVVQPQRVLENAAAVAEFAGTTGDLRTRFMAALDHMQSYQFPWRSDGDIAFVFDDADDSILRATIAALMAVDQVPANWRYQAHVRPAVHARVSEALALLGSVDAELGAALRTTIGALIFGLLPGYEGGSTSRVIGAIWVGLSPDASASDLALFLLHEFVHHCLFLEDMVRGIFVGHDRLGEPDALATSALRRVPRPFDKALHSAYVAVTLEYFQVAAGLPADPHSFTATARTISELTAKTEFVSNHGCTCLADLARSFLGLATGQPE